MLMERKTTWNGIGVQASENNLDVLLKEANLDYTAVARDLYVDAGESQILVPDRKMIVREDNNELFGIVSDKYRICQNRDALDFVQYIEGIELQKAGSIGGYVYMIANMPEMKILGDKIQPNLIFQNSHDGSCSIRATICMLRIVCQNQFVRTFKSSPATIRISHMGNVEAKMSNAQETFSNLTHYLQNFNEEAEGLASEKISPKKFDEILAHYFSVKEDISKRRSEKIELDRENFIKAYNTSDNQNFIGTKWGMVNAFSDYITHNEPLRKSENYEVNRFYRSLNNEPMDQFIELLKAA